MWFLQYCVKPSGFIVIYHPYVIRFIYQEKVVEAEKFFPTADIIIPI